MARRGFLVWFADTARENTWRGTSGPDPDRPADYGPGASMRRADRFTGHGQPRQYADRQRIRSRAALALVAADARPLAVSSPAGGDTVVMVDHRRPDPIGWATIASINAMYGAGQAGQLGEIRWGAPGMPRDSVYDGELGQLQSMHGAQTVYQDARNVSPGFNRSNFRGGMLTGLPNTSAAGDLPLSDAQAVLIETAGNWG